MNWRRLTRMIGIAAIALLLAVSFTPLSNVVGRQLSVSPEVLPVDAIVVLGSGAMADGSLTYESTRRLMFGLRLYKSGLAPLLIVSGPSLGGAISEATVRRKIAVELGVPETAVLEASKVNTTRDEALAIAALLAPRQARRVLLVTESLHMRRAMKVFEAVGLTVLPAPSDNAPASASSPRERMALTIDLVVQLAGLVYYRVAGFIR